MSYFILVDSPSVVINSYNPRLAELEAKIIRGTITDKNGIILAESKLVNDKVTRTYPFGDAFAHVVGFTGQGKTGIEASYDLDLLSNHQGIVNNFLSSIAGTPGHGDELRLTLDSRLQLLANELLKGKKGAIVAMEPSTGKILAMASAPSFDPNTIAFEYAQIIADEKSAALLNRGSQGVYPPGSTFKILTTLAYLENHDASEFHHVCTGKIPIGDRYIHCYQNTAHGEVTLSEAFAYSCNTSFAAIGEQLDLNYMNELAERLYFNQNLPFALVSSRSTYQLLEDGTPAERAETLIGQGRTTMTPLHNAVLTSVIANAGVMMKPYILDAIYNEQGKGVTNYIPERVDTILSPQDARKITTYMEDTTVFGTAKGTFMDSIRIASKTGSAENPHGAAHAWYVGFAPIDSPELVLSIVIENVGSSTQHAVPLAKKLYEAYFSYE